MADRVCLDSISGVIRKAPTQYVRAYLNAETDESDTTYLLLHQLRVLNEAIVGLHANLHRKIEERRDARQLLEQSSALHRRLNHRRLGLLDHALEHPKYVYRIDRHQSSHHVTYQTARTDLLDPVEMGLLEKSTVGRTFIIVPPDDLRARLDRLRHGTNVPQ